MEEGKQEGFSNIMDHEIGTKATMKIVSGNDSYMQKYLAEGTKNYVSLIELQKICGERSKHGEVPRDYEYPGAYSASGNTREV